jgi:deazaflavin-dependent oxidoreductase (nitroreductase family)
MPFPTNPQVIDEFRAGGGQVGGPFAGAPLILLTTTGARTGLPRTSPTMYLAEGDRLHVFASNAGGPHNPAWYHNLRADPRVVVEIGRDDVVERFAAVASEITGAERDRIYTRQAELVPAFAGYQAATSRVIPVVALEPVTAGRDDPAGRNARLTASERETRGEGGPGRSGERAAGLGAQLRAIHDGLRSDLADLRAQLADGHQGARLSPSLQQHCLTFCGSVAAHHDRESAAFPDLERRFPELGPGLQRIRAEHVVVARIVGELRDLLAGGTERDAMRAGIDRLAAELDVHFAYEEAQLVPALNAA